MVRWNKQPTYTLFVTRLIKYRQQRQLPNKLFKPIFSYKLSCFVLSCKYLKGVEIFAILNRVYNNAFSVFMNMKRMIFTRIYLITLSNEKFGKNVLKK